MPTGIYKHKPRTEETKRKIGLANSVSLKGRRISKESIRKRSETRRKLFEEGKIIINKGKKFSEETRKKMSESRLKRKERLGYLLSPEARKKLSAGRLERKKILGYLISSEVRNKISESLRGEKSPYWLGGKSFEPYSLDWTKTLKKSIRERDHYICQNCSADGLIIHHIDYNKKNCNPNNLITLCKSCHAKTNHNRNNWSEYFKSIINGVINHAKKQC